MTAVAIKEHAGRTGPPVDRSVLPWPRIPWPEGTTWFAFRTWVALALAYYAAFHLELEGAASAGVCVLIVAQPRQGMVLSKSLYRLAATLVGGTVAVALTALFPQDRTMLLASFAFIMALQTALGTLLRDFRSYACVLAGYTIAIISIQNIDAPQAVFMSALDRMAAIVVGIAAVAVTNSVLATAESSVALATKLREATSSLLVLAGRAMDERCAPDAATCIELSARLMPLRSEITFATPEKPNGRARAEGARSALLGLFELIPAVQAVGIGLRRLEAPSALVDRAVEIGRRALRLQHPERCLAELEELIAPALEAGSLSMPEAFVFDRLHFLVETLGFVRDGLRCLRFGWWPKRSVTVDVSQDLLAVVLNGSRVLVAVGTVAILSVWSGIAETAAAVLFTAVFVSLGSTSPNPALMGRTALIGMPLVVLIGSLYSFFVFPLIDGYPLFILSLAPLVVVMCWLITVGLPGAGLIFTVQTIVLISPANTQVLDPPAFVATATMLALSGVTIFLSFFLVLPVQPAARRLRLALGVGRSLRNALADKNKRRQPRASLHFDRLAQFKLWQGAKAPTLARRRTMQRLVDFGNLAFAVRRAWRALDRARGVLAPDLAIRIETVLPTLSPQETFALAEACLRAARGMAGRPSLALVRMAAALHGTALVTSNELRLLRRIHLLNRSR